MKNWTFLKIYQIENFGEFDHFLNPKVFSIIPILFNYNLPDFAVTHRSQLAARVLVFTKIVLF